MYDNTTSDKHIEIASEARIFLTTAEYFAGIGLVRLGLERAGWRTVFANDIAIDKYQMYAAFFDDAPNHYIVENIFQLNMASIPSAMLATASFPCIDLSLAGNLNGLGGKHSSAFWGFINILRNQDLKPPLVMLENVTGWLNSNKGRDFRVTIQALNELGYACDVYHIDAIRFTAQSRPRIFVVGQLIADPNQNYWNILQRPGSIAPKSLKNAIKDSFDLIWNTVDVPTLPPKNRSGLSSIIEELDEGDQRWWSNEEVDRHLAMMSDIHLSRVKQLQNQTKLSYRTMYRRVRSGLQRAEIRENDTAGCLRTARGGSSRQMIVRAGYGRVRMRHMTPREYARLQGVPDNYPLPKQTNQALSGFGDAVCVPVITWLANNILNPLAYKLIDDLSVVHL